MPFDRTGSTNKTAKLYSIVIVGHTCPYGIKSKWLLEL